MYPGGLATDIRVDRAIESFPADGGKELVPLFVRAGGFFARILLCGRFRTL